MVEGAELGVAEPLVEGAELGVADSIWKFRELLVEGAELGVADSSYGNFGASALLVMSSESKTGIHWIET